MKLGSGPTLDAAIERIYTVASRVGGDFARKWALELKLIGERLAERSRYGPKHVGWRTEAGRIQLAADVAEYGLERRLGLAGAKELADRLPALERKAVNSEDILELAAVRLSLESIIGAEVEQVRLEPPRSRGKAAGLEGKAIQGWPPDKERDFMRLVRRIGGFVPDGGRAGSIFDFDATHVERATQLVNTETEPASDDERRELDRWLAKYPPGESRE